MTKHIHQASFGQMQLTGDYYPSLVNIDYNDIVGNSDNFFMGKVVERLNLDNPVDITTAHGNTISGSDFDLWNTKSNYSVSVAGADNSIDYMVVVIDNTLPPGTLVDGCGSGAHISPLAPNNTILGNTIDGNFLMGGCEGIKDGSLLKHEFNHSFFGGNTPYHTATRNWGAGTFLANIMGYSMMGGWGETSVTCNGWDRNRLGWIPIGKQFDLSSLNESNYTETESDLTYLDNLDRNGSDNLSDLFILRDFITYGDIIRIEMPFVQSDKPNARPQYLWLENRQNLSGNLDQHANATDGVYAYMQVGMEGFDNLINSAPGTSSFGPNNYTYPILCSGRWDYNLIGTLDPNSAFGLDVWFDESDANPFMGNIFQSMPMYDKDNDGIIFRDEDIYVGSYQKRDLQGGVLLDGSDQYDSNELARGTTRDAYVPGTGLSLSTNPAPVPVFTYQTQSNNNTAPHQINSMPRVNWETRSIYLNNIGINIVETRPNPQGNGNDIVVEVKWNENSINSDVRWCGDIISSSGVHLFFNNQSTYIDRSMTSNIPYEEPDGIFSLPTSLSLRNGSITNVNGGAKMYIRDNSSLNVEHGAVFKVDDTHPWIYDAPFLEIQSNATMNIASDLASMEGVGSKIVVDGELSMEQSSLLTIKNSSTLEIGVNGKLSIHPDNIYLEDEDSRVVVYGELEILNDEDFNVFGEGRFVFGPNSIITLGTNASFSVNGSSETDIKVEFLANTLMDLNTHNVNISDCKILFHENSTFSSNSNDVSLTNSSFEGLGTTSLIDLSLLNSLSVTQCTFIEMGTGINVSNTNVEPFIFESDFVNSKGRGLKLENLSSCKIYDSNFTYTTLGGTYGIGIDAQNITELDVRNCNFEGASFGMFLNNFNSPVGSTAPKVTNCEFSYCSSGVSLNSIPAISFEHCDLNNNEVGLSANNSDVLNYFNGKIEGNVTGVYLDETEKFAVSTGSQLNYFNTSLIRENDIGIYARYSNVFISNRTTISNNQIGIEMLGENVDENILVVGDLGCVSIVENGQGIIGHDFFLDIDAQIHACNRGNCNVVTPIRFNDNDNIFEVCYDEISITEILARENYWGEISSGVASGINSFNYQFSNDCAYSTNDITVDDQDWVNSESCGKHFLVKEPIRLSTVMKLPTFSQFKSGDYDPEENVDYYDTEIILINDMYTEYVQSSDRLLSWLNDRTVADIFEEGYRFYLSEDYSSAQIWMSAIAALDIEIFDDAKSKYLIHKARNLVDVCIVMDSYANAFKTDSETNSLLESHFENKIDILPNPVIDKLLIANRSSMIVSYQLFDLYGRVLKEGNCEYKESLDLSSFSSGTYILVVNSNQSDMSLTKKIVKK